MKFSALIEELTGLDGSQAALIVTMGGAYVGKHRCKDGTRHIRSGEVVSAWYRLPLEMVPVAFQPQWVLVDDNRLLVAAKPAGLPTQGRRDADYLAFYELLRQNLNGYLGLHHRLDQDTSGLMLFTRDRSFNCDVARAFSERLVEKTYLAVCRGSWPFADGSVILRDPIGPRRTPGGTHQEVNPNGKAATTELHRLHSWDDRVLVQARPHTGRTHQIRVHLAHHGLPLAGDQLYGGGAGGFLLHCHHLAWPVVGALPKGHYRLSVPEAWLALGDSFRDFYRHWWGTTC